MSTFNALANQPNKESNFYMKNTGIAVWWRFSGKQPNYSFSWQVLLSQVLIFTQQVYIWYNHVLNLFQQYQQLYPR